jgi:hypothetical protein
MAIKEVAETSANINMRDRLETTVLITAIIRSSNLELNELEYLATKSVKIIDQVYGKNNL